MQPDSRLHEHEPCKAHDIDKYINSYVNILLRLFHSAHVVGLSLSHYVRIANKINDILRKIKYDCGLDYLTIVIYRVSVTTNYSFGPIDQSLRSDVLGYNPSEHGIRHDVVNNGCVITKLNIIDISRNTRCLVNV